jgi:Phospholipase_D-nuclease N-terminal
MIHITDGVLLVLEFGLGFFAFIDVALSPEAAVPWIPRWGWIIGILIFPIVGGVAWLVAGRPRRAKLRGAAAAQAAVAAADPNDVSGQVSAAVRRARACHFGSLEEDAALLAQLWDVNEEHEQTLRRWEEDLRRREEALRQRARRDQAARGRHMDAA